MRLFGEDSQSALTLGGYLREAYQEALASRVQPLLGEKAALDFVSDAYAHCKAIGHTAVAGPLLDKVGAAPDGFFCDLAAGTKPLITKLATRHWAREQKVKLPV